MEGLAAFLAPFTDQKSRRSQRFSLTPLLNFDGIGQSTKEDLISISLSVANHPFFVFTFPGTYHSYSYHKYLDWIVPLYGDHSTWFIQDHVDPLWGLE